MRCSLKDGGAADRAGKHSLTPAVLSVALFVFAVCSFFALSSSCAQVTKLQTIRRDSLSTSIRLPEKNTYVPEMRNVSVPQRDTLKVTGPDGREVIIMKAVRDDETGEMVATEQIDAAVVTARFRNIAERRGRIDLEFQVVVPPGMQDSRWQIRMHPDMFLLADSVRLDDVVITGDAYRKAQLRGYQQYERFISRIIDDTLAFVHIRNLEIFLKRNIPELYAFKTDSSFVSDEQFATCFGVTERQAIEHYTNRFLLHRNERRKARSGRMWQKYVKNPIVTDGIRLDTVMRGDGGEFIYNYVQTVNTRPQLRKIDIVLSGEIYEQDSRIYTIPRSQPLTFYISSVSSFADRTERYITRIISRNSTASMVCNIDFEQGKWDVREDLADNSREITAIKQTIRRLLSDDNYELDSVIIAASASPEGSQGSNEKLSFERARSASGYFDSFVSYFRDSVRRAEGMFIDVGENFSEGAMRQSDAAGETIEFLARSGGENWTDLRDYVLLDTLLAERDKYVWTQICDAEPDLDERERRLQGEPSYSYIRDTYYPRLRTVRFNFALSRRGMLKDTVHTTVLDTAYMRGVQLLTDHDYEAALQVLRPYNDYNTAVAYVALDYNASALSILSCLPRTPQVNYMLALVHSRQGDDQNAVQHYLDACRQDRSYVSRGNLDPEIAALIKKYGLNAEPDDDYLEY